MDAQGSGGGSARVPAEGDRTSASTAGVALDGLSSDEAERRLREYGPNAVKEESRRPTHS